MGGLNPQPSLRIDFDSGLASINAGPPIPVTLSPNADPLVVQFEMAFAGQPMRFTGRMNGSDISGTIANFTLSLTRLPDNTPRLAARRRYPLPRPKEAEAIAKARELAADLVTKQGIPGLSVAVARRGTVIWSEGFGLADVESGVPVTSQTCFRAGSVSKVLTAAGVARLVEEGKLDLDAPIQRYVPGFPKKQWPITTRQLAAHTAGIRHYGDVEALRLKGAPHFASIREGLTLFQDDPLLSEPGTNYSYSSYGWTAVSAVIEGASGQEFLSFMSDAVFEPLGLRSIVPNHVDAIVPGRYSLLRKGSPGAASRKRSPRGPELCLGGRGLPCYGRRPCSVRLSASAAGLLQTEHTGPALQGAESDSARQADRCRNRLARWQGPRGQTHPPSRWGERRRPRCAPHVP